MELDWIAGPRFPSFEVTLSRDITAKPLRNGLRGTTAMPKKRNRLAFISVGQRLHKEGEQLIVCSLSLSCIDHAGVVVLEVPTNAHHAA